MRREITTSTAALLAVLGMSSTPAVAEENGVYLVANYGRAPKLLPHSDLDEALVGVFHQSLTIESSSVRKQDTWSAGVGYRMGQNFAIEATYLHLGKLHYEASGTTDQSGSTQATHLDLDTKTSGPSLALVWSLSIWNDWGLDARAGVYRGTTSTQAVNTVGESAVPFSVSTRATSPFLGLGGSYIVTEHLIARLDYAHLNGVKEKAFDKSFNADVVTAGITYEF